MRYLLVSMVMALSGIAAVAQEGAAALDEALYQADGLVQAGQYGPAVVAYRALLNAEGLPGVFRPLVLTRLALAAQGAGQADVCREVIGQLRGLDYLPEHYRLTVEELEAALAGRPQTVFQRTPIPTAVKAAVTLEVRPGGEFKTVTAALQRARELRGQAGLAEGAIEIVLAGGVHVIEQTIHLAAEDSGTARNPLVIRSAPGAQRPVLRGGLPLTKWQAESDAAILARLPEVARGRVQTASLAANGLPRLDDFTLGGFSSQRRGRTVEGTETLLVPELFYQGRAQTLARWPNEGDLASPLEGFTDDRPLRWTEETTLWLHGYWRYQWADAYEKVQQIDAAGRKIVLTPPVNGYGFENPTWHAVNALSEIDQPGEYHIDLAGQTIRFLPPDGFKPDQCMLSLYGPILTAKNCDFVTLRDLNLEYIRGDGMVLNGCNDLIVAGCSIRAASGYGLIANGGLRHTLHSIVIDHMGGGGLIDRSGDWRQLIPSGTLVENCRISDLSRVDRTYTPALVVEGMGQRVRYNHFSRIPSSAARIGAGEAIFEFNEFADCVSESDDQGAIDVWGNPLLRGIVIRWNWFHDIKGRHGMVAGVRLDDAISGFLITGNIFQRVGGGSFGGVQIHGGKDNYIENNLFVDCQVMVSNSGWGDARWKDMMVSHSFIADNLKNTPWQGDAWQQRYPMLRTLMTSPADRNNIAGNLAINCGTLYRNMSGSAQIFGNRPTARPATPNKAAELFKLLPPGLTARPAEIGARN